MGAYSNPQQNVDTQTGQYYKQLQNTITESGEKAILAISAKQARDRAELKENETKIKEIQTGVEKSKLGLYSNISTLSAASPGVDFSKTYDPLVKEYGDIQTRLDNFSSTDRTADLKKMSAIKSSVSLSQSDIATLQSSLPDMITGLNNINQVGGLYTGIPGKGGVDPKNVHWANIYSGKSPGTKSLVVDPNNPTARSWKAEWIDADGNPDSYIIDGNKMSELNDSGSGQFTYVPNQFEPLQQTKMNSGVYKSTQTQNAKGVTVTTIGDISDKYLSEVVKVASDDKMTGRKVNNLFRKVNKEKIAADFLEPDNIQATGLIAMDLGKSAEAWYNTVYAKKPGSGYMDAAEIITEDGAAKFKKAYHDYHVDSIPKQQAILSADSKQAQEVIDTTPKTSTTGLTPTQLEARATDLDAFNQELESGEITIKGKSYVKVGGVWNKVIDKERSAKGKNLSTKIDRNNPESKDVDVSYLKRLAGIK